MQVKPCNCMSNVLESDEKYRIETRRYSEIGHPECKQSIKGYGNLTRNIKMICIANIPILK